jgi:hypothetical protein
MNGQTQWLFEAPFVLERNLSNNLGNYSNSEWESKDIPPSKALPTSRACNNQGIPVRTPVKVLTTANVKCTKAQAFGVTRPFSIVAKAVKRALEMLDNTINELVNARNAVCGGATPAWPLLGDITLCTLKNGLSINIDDIRVWTAGAFENRSIAEVIRRLIRVRNLIASNDIQYFCTGRCDPADPTTGCVSGDWAFTCIPNPCPKGAKGIDRIIHLCQNFWIPASGVTRRNHSEFQAQTIIHETSHIYHCTTDPTASGGRTIGLAECFSQFVAATNDSPIDPSFAKACIGMSRCLPSGKVSEFEISELSFVRSSSARIAKTIFRPQNAIRLKGRPAIKR